jgi:pectate lyase
MWKAEGWATIAGEGVPMVTGGQDGETVRVTSGEQLSSAAGGDEPRVIEIEGSIDLSRVDVGSNKTLLGIGEGATINGGLVIKGSSAAAVTNVIIQNLHINGARSALEDAVQVQFAHHVWFDHCDIYDGPDGNLDMTHAVNWATISWTIFRYSPAYMPVSPDEGDHRFSNLIGHSDDNGGEDRGRLKISLHHNWWSDGVRERMPRVRFGEVHVYNNYYTSSDSNYCVGAGSEAHLLVENNYFDGVRTPHRYINSADQGTAYVTERGNVYQNTSGDRVTGGGGQPFTDPPYEANADPADSVPALVSRCAGPRAK